jgi:hypothetical protein
MVNIAEYAGNYFLDGMKRMPGISVAYPDAPSIKSFTQLALANRSTTKLKLELAQNEQGPYLLGFLTLYENAQYAAYFNHFNPHTTLEGVIYYEGAALYTTLSDQDGKLRGQVVAPAPEGSDLPPWVGLKFTFAKSFASEPTIKSQPLQAQTRFQSNSRLVGHWRHSNHYASGGGPSSFSGFTETNLILAENGRFIRTSQSFASSSFRNAYGNWTGMASAGSVPNDERGDWGIVKNQLYLEFDNQTYMACDYYLEGKAMLCYYPSGQQLWEKIR